MLRERLTLVHPIPRQEFHAVLNAMSVEQLGALALLMKTMPPDLAREVCWLAVAQEFAGLKDREVKALIKAKSHCTDDHAGSAAAYQATLGPSTYEDTRLQKGAENEATDLIDEIGDNDERREAPDPE